MPHSKVNKQVATPIWRALMLAIAAANLAGCATAPPDKPEQALAAFRAATTHANEFIANNRTDRGHHHE